MTIDELHCDYTPMDLNTVIDLLNPGTVPTASTEAQDSQDGPTQVMNDHECDSTPALIVVEWLVSRTTSAPTKNNEIQNKYPPASPSEIQKESPPTLLYKIQQECCSPDVEIINSDNTLPLDTVYEFLDEMDSQTWWDFTSFFMLPQNENDGTDPTRKILIHGMLQDIPSHQLYYVFWMLLKNQELEQDGFIADKMEIGKTMEMILYFVLGAWIIYNCLHIKQYCKNPAMANKHLSVVMDTEEEHKSPKQYHLRCSSQNMFPILCACVPDRVTAHCLSQPLQDAILVVVLKDLLLPWAREWVNSISSDSGNCLKLNLFIGYRDLTPTKIGNLGHTFIQTAQHAILRQHDLGPQ
ncbi:conserved hypothetical protein [Coccidioides posadasii str. Silveira]|uniref:Uncharacterized protein n=1 Tax=Coccidioides posadasii (strain RMSCC 757 / Silveira) TaxID=443226 RepID=E9DH21_COCPS|nr:conserved hypothetical protein [Coccidioides posadasii str. Silveira]